ncbi:MAG TPA: hypothetical protein VE994_02715 [Terriglobales bacterium]|nr:hypothetical protein [Terriglobales bacterium]
MKLRIATVGLALMMWAAPAFGQGCAMCYSSALGAGTKGQQALSRAVTILLIPPVGMMIGLVGMGALYARRRDRAHDEAIEVAE